MDQLTAYRVLGVEPDCSPEEIKEAYATLSKQYHPEEEPEKFQEIHEAYVALTRRNRRGSVQNVQYVEEQKDEPIESPTKFNFEDVLEKAQQQEQEKLHELVLEAAAEFKILASPKYNSNLKAYRTLFEDKKYESIIKRADFLEKLCDVLEETKLKKNIYDYIIDFYRLRGMNPSELSQIGLRLYQILDHKVGIKQKTNPAVYGGVAAGLVAGFRVFRPVIRQSEILTTVVLCVCAVFFLVWIFKKLREKGSALLTQAVIAILLAISQFVVIMFDAYGTLFGTVDDGNTVAALILLAAMFWFVVVIVIAVIKAIVGFIKRRI